MLAQGAAFRPHRRADLLRVDIRWRADRRGLAGGLKTFGIEFRHPGDDPAIAARTISAAPSARFMASASAAPPSRNSLTITRSRSVFWRLVVRISGTAPRRGLAATGQ